MIKAILLDLGRVIVPFDFAIGYRAFEARCGLPTELIRERIRETGLVPQLETGQLPPGEFVSRICQAVGLQLTYSEFGEIWNSIFSHETLIPESFLKDLHRTYRLILVSNTNAIHFEMIRAHFPLLCHFDALILSYEVGAMKPAPAIFQAAVRAAGCAPDECFFTDDIPEYVEAARQLGIHAVVFQSFAQLQTSLQGHGVCLSAS